MVAEFFSSVGSQLLNGFLGSQANAQGVLLSAEQQKELMNSQAKTNWKYYQKELLNRWQLARQGLENGNYNPMLALQGINGNSNWASQASISDTGAGQAFNAGSGNALTMQQIRQQGQLNDSQIELNNADSFKSEMQANTELFKQLNIDSDTKLRESQRILTDKESSYYERVQAREDYKVALKEKEINNNYSIGLGQLANQRVQNSLMDELNNSIIPINNAKAVQEEWNSRHPYQSRLLPGVPGTVGALGGAIILKGSKVAVPTTKHAKPYATSVPYTHSYK